MSSAANPTLHSELTGGGGREDNNAVGDDDRRLSLPPPQPSQPPPSLQSNSFLSPRDQIQDSLFTQPNISVSDSGISSPKSTQTLPLLLHPRKQNDVRGNDDDTNFDRLLFSEELFAGELDACGWEKALSGLCDDANSDVIDIFQTPRKSAPAAPRRFGCPVCAFLEKKGKSRGKAGRKGEDIGEVARRFAWIIEQSDDVEGVLADFREKEVDKEMVERLREVIRVMKEKLSETVDGLFESEMAAVEKFEKRQAKINYRYRILSEIASTEKDYYKSLVIITDVWKRDFVDSGIVSPELVEQMFSNVDELAEATDAMVKLIDVEKEKDYKSQMVGKIFVKLIPELKAYVKYCSLQDRAQKTYYDLIKSNSKFKELATVKKTNKKIIT